MLLSIVSLAAYALLGAIQPVPIERRPVPIARLPLTNAPQTTEVPWSVRLDFTPIAGGTGTTCSGSALTAHWILTAAHCLEGKSIRNSEVTVLYVDSSGDQQVAYPKGSASFYNHPDFGGSGSVSNLITDRADDIGLVRLYGAGINPEQSAMLYSGTQKPWDHINTDLADIYVAAYGLGTPPGGSQSCSGASYDGIKRLGRFELTGDADDDGFLGMGPTIAIEANNPYGNSLCGGDSGGPWTVLRAGRYLLLGVHSGSRTDLNWTNKKWAAVVAPKLDWIVRKTKKQGLPIQCTETIIKDHRSGSIVDASYKTCREVP